MVHSCIERGIFTLFFLHMVTMRFPLLLLSLLSIGVTTAFAPPARPTRPFLSSLPSSSANNNNENEKEQTNNNNNNNSAWFAPALGVGAFSIYNQASSVFHSLVDSDKVQSLQPILNGPVAIPTAILFASLSCMTIQTLHQRNVAINSITIGVREQAKSLLVLSKTFSPEKQLKIKSLVDSILRNESLSNEQLNLLIKELDYSSKETSSQAYYINAIALKLRDYQAQLMSNQTRPLPSSIYTNMVLLGVALQGIYLVESSTVTDASLQFPLATCWALLVTTFASVGIVISDLSSSTSTLVLEDSSSVQKEQEDDSTVSHVFGALEVVVNGTFGFISGLFGGISKAQEEFQEIQQKKERQQQEQSQSIPTSRPATATTTSAPPTIPRDTTTASSSIPKGTAAAPATLQQRKDVSPSIPRGTAVPATPKRTTTAPATAQQNKVSPSIPRGTSTAKTAASSVPKGTAAVPPARPKTAPRPADARGGKSVSEGADSRAKGPMKMPPKRQKSTSAPPTRSKAISRDTKAPAPGVKAPSIPRASPPAAVPVTPSAGTTPSGVTPNAVAEAAKKIADDVRKMPPKPKPQTTTTRKGIGYPDKTKARTSAPTTSAPLTPPAPVSSSPRGDSVSSSPADVRQKKPPNKQPPSTSTAAGGAGFRESTKTRPDLSKAKSSTTASTPPKKPVAPSASTTGGTRFPDADRSDGPIRTPPPSRETQNAGDAGFRESTRAPDLSSSKFRDLMAPQASSVGTPGAPVIPSALDPPAPMPDLSEYGGTMASQASSAGTPGAPVIPSALDPPAPVPVNPPATSAVSSGANITPPAQSTPPRRRPDTVSKAAGIPDSMDSSTMASASSSASSFPSQPLPDPKTSAPASPESPMSANNPATDPSMAQQMTPAVPDTNVPEDTAAASDRPVVLERSQFTEPVPIRMPAMGKSEGKLLSCACSCGHAER